MGIPAQHGSRFTSTGSFALKFATTAFAGYCVFLISLGLLVGCAHKPGLFTVKLQRKFDPALQDQNGPGPITINVYAVSPTEVRKALTKSLQDLGFSFEPRKPACSELPALAELSSADSAFCTDIVEVQQSHDPLLAELGINDIRNLGVETSANTFYGLRMRGRWMAEQKGSSRLLDRLKPAGPLPGKTIKSPRVDVTINISAVLYYRGYGSEFVLYPNDHYRSDALLKGVEKLIRTRLKEL